MALKKFADSGVDFSALLLRNNFVAANVRSSSIFLLSVSDTARMNGDLGDFDGDSKGDFKQDLEGDLLSSSGPGQVWFSCKIKFNSQHRGK